VVSLDEADQILHILGYMAAFFPYKTDPGSHRRIQRDADQIRRGSQQKGEHKAHRCTAGDHILHRGKLGGIQQDIRCNGQLGETAHDALRLEKAVLKQHQRHIPQLLQRDEASVSKGMVFADAAYILKLRQRFSPEITVKGIHMGQEGHVNLAVCKTLPQAAAAILHNAHLEPGMLLEVLTI